MTLIDIRFISKNEFKLKEARVYYHGRCIFVYDLIRELLECQCATEKAFSKREAIWCERRRNRAGTSSDSGQGFGK
jgi:hypothetical protein